MTKAAKSPAPKFERLDRTRSRSNLYQNTFLESSCAPDILAKFQESQGLTSGNSSQHQEELADLKERLRLATWRLIDTKLTVRQREVLHLCADGYTQVEIAAKLFVNQSSVTKSLNGNVDYKNGRKCYGGSLRKLRKLSVQDSEISAILDRIAELSSD